VRLSSLVVRGGIEQFDREASSGGSLDVHKSRPFKGAQAFPRNPSGQSPTDGRQAKAHRADISAAGFPPKEKPNVQRSPSQPAGSFQPIPRDRPFQEPLARLMPWRALRLPIRDRRSDRRGQAQAVRIEWVI
jgi:hypothetical protein